jgi:hypothetical protein
MDESFEEKKVDFNKVVEPLFGARKKKNQVKI